LEARVMNIFFLVCTGRGETMTDLSPDQYEAALAVILQSQQHYPNMIIRPRCAPHSKRVAHQLDAHATNNQISGMTGDGCIAGRHYCRVTPKGEVTACPYIDTSVGNIRDQKLTQIWQQAEAFQQLRNPVLTGKCGVCEYSQLCGGCRARPVAQGQSLMASDSLCQYQPADTPVILPIINNTATIEWSVEATERLSRAPGFVRNMIKQRVELEMAKKGEVLVLPEHLSTMIAQRFGSMTPARPKPVSDQYNSN
jgi:radical SAM protein with 4Fe4S-binding SPASM domain